MTLNLQEVFTEVAKRVPELGVEKKFKDLSALSGPPNPDWLDGRVLYEVYPRAFSEQGNFAALTERLESLKNIGIEILWLMPVYPIGRKERKGKSGSPYAIRDYFNVNPEYGSKADFKDLVRRAHRLGMRVIIDMVPNHVAPDFETLHRQPDLICRDAEGRPKRKVADWSDVVDLDYLNTHTRSFMAEVMQFWIDEFDVDGYRCDVAGLVPADFWEWVIPQLRKRKSDFYLLAEWESPDLHRVGFNSTYDWSTLRLLRQVFAGETKIDLLADWILTKSAIYPHNSLPLRFLENHDLPRARRLFSGEQLFAAMTLLFSLHGLPLLYNGQEIGTTHRPSLFEKEPIDWKNKDQRVFNVVRELIDLRKREPALSSKTYHFDRQALNRGILAFKKGEECKVIVNLTDRILPLEQNLISDVKTIVFDSKSAGATQNDLQRLEAYQAVIVKTLKD